MSAPRADTVSAIRCTFGFWTSTDWTDRRELPWPELTDVLTTHEIGAKEGRAFTPATFSGTRRVKSDTQEIGVALLDSDTGRTMAEIETSVRARGWAAVVSSTHSHLTTQTKASRSNVDRFRHDNPHSTPADFLVNDKGMLPRVAAGARQLGADDVFAYFEHQPCPKFRVAIRLLRPWRASDYRSQDAANHAWKERVEALAAALGLEHDQSCTDTSRLFFLPRRAANSPLPETCRIVGVPCDLFALPAAARAAETAGARYEQRLGAGLFDGGTGQARPEADTGEFADPETGEMFDLRAWARNYGERFKIADALRARKPGTLTGHIADRVKVHCRCPNDDRHTEPGPDGATFVVNAGDSDNVGFVIHCRHAHCTGKDRLAFLRLMLEQRWLAASDLTAPGFLVSEEADDPPPYPPGYAESLADARTEEQPRSRGRNRRSDPNFVWPVPHDFLSDPNSEAPELSHRHIPEAINDFVFDTAARLGVDPSAVALACIVSCASVANDDWKVQPRRWDYTWTESARPWGALLGPPSIKKTPVINACTKPIDKLDAAARRRHAEAMRIYKQQMKAAKADKSGGTPEPTYPKLDRYLVENATMEALQEILRVDDEAKQRVPANKVLCRQDEMSEFFANLDRYNAGGKGGGDRGGYLRLWNGGPYSVDRIVRGIFATPNWSATFLGGMQPGPIQKIAQNTAEDGLLQRFLFVVPSHQPPGVDRKPSAASRDRYAALFPALVALHPPKTADGKHTQVVTLHADAHRHREAVEARAEILAMMPDTSPQMLAAIGKWPGQFARIALTFHLVEIADASASGETAPYPMVISEQTARRASAFMLEIALPHLFRAHRTMFSTAQTCHAEWIAGYILAERFERITSRDVVRSYKALHAPEARDELAAVMNSLVTLGWLEPETPASPVKPVHAWAVNPAVHVRFADRAERETDRREKARAAIAAHFEALKRDQEAS